jgi:hypothetical protein
MATEEKDTEHQSISSEEEVGTTMGVEMEGDVEGDEDSTLEYTASEAEQEEDELEFIEDEFEGEEEPRITANQSPSAAVMTACG